MHAVPGNEHPEDCFFAPPPHASRGRFSAMDRSVVWRYFFSLDNLMNGGMVAGV